MWYPIFSADIARIRGIDWLNILGLSFVISSSSVVSFDRDYHSVLFHKKLF